MSDLQGCLGSAPCDFGAYRLGLGQPRSVGLGMMPWWSAWLEQVMALV